MSSKSPRNPAPTSGPAAELQFTGAVLDHMGSDGHCQFCEAEALRVTFEVRQADDEDVRSMCEQCIGRHPIMVEQDGRMLEGAEKMCFLSGLAVKLINRTCRDVLRYLCSRTDDAELDEITAYFTRNMQLSPRRAARLFLTLQHSSMGVDPSIFQVQIRSSAHKHEFAELSETEKLAVWPVLSAAVHQRLRSMGHEPASLRSRRRGEREAALRLGAPPA